MKGPNFGPYNQQDEVQAFYKISKKAFAIFDNAIALNWESLSRPLHHLFIRMSYQAKSTSMAIGLINSWALNLQAIALLRTRLEQIIVCSYLIYEDEDKGLRRFVIYVPIQDQKNIAAAMESSDLRKELQGIIDPSLSMANAEEAQEALSPGISLDNGKFQRKWTDLDLRSMAKRRDNLAANKKGAFNGHSLEREYLSIYKVSSSVVHADCASLSYRFLDLIPSPSGKKVLMALPAWAPIVAAATAHYDLLQCYEIQSWLKTDFLDEYESLLNDWKEATKRFI